MLRGDVRAFCARGFSISAHRAVTWTQSCSAQEPLRMGGRSLGVVCPALIPQRCEPVCCIPVSPGCSWIPEKGHDILQYGLDPPRLALPGELQQENGNTAYKSFNTDLRFVPGWTNLTGLIKCLRLTFSLVTHMNLWDIWW